MSPSSLMSMRLNLSSNSLMMEEEVSQINEQKKPGIISILGSSDSATKSTKAASLRRTLSADMSSKTWLAQNGFSSMKKIASSEEFPISEEEEEEEEEAEADEIWASIQKDKKRQEVGKEAQVDMWNSILLSSNNKQDDGKESSAPLPPLYVHPLVKRSASALSQKSLQICTESLGSETGSEGFSSDSLSELSDEENNNKEERREMLQNFKEVQIAKYSVSSYHGDKKPSSLRSFPPPIPSLSPSLRMQSHRENGRLVLEAVSFPTKNNFRAQRQDGRLLLTFIKKDEEVCVEKKKDVFDVIDVIQEEEAGAKLEEKGEEMIDAVAIAKAVDGPKFVASRVIDIPNRGAIMANKFMRLFNRNSSWAKFNENVKLDDEEELAENESKTLLPQSLPPPPRVPRLIPPIPAPPSAATAASFNAYEYCWRRKPSLASATSFMPTLTGKNQTPPPSPKNNINNNMLALSKSSAYANCKSPPEKSRSDDFKVKNKADYLVPFTRNCKEPRRPLSFWETYCIATST